MLTYRCMCQKTEFYDMCLTSVLRSRYVGYIVDYFTHRSRSTYTRDALSAQAKSNLPMYINVYIYSLISA